ncbi:HNH endonuclease [Archangium lansingense]|uniref:HNH endonuclease n=1 Tax=Archangium lansingense TaxID=2995310 RepID=UPI003B821D4E
MQNTIRWGILGTGQVTGFLLAASLMLMACATDGTRVAGPGTRSTQGASSRHHLPFIESWRKPSFTEDGRLLPYKDTRNPPTLITNLGRNRAGQTVSNGKVTVKFDRDGFAEFNTKFETLLDDVHVGSGQRFSHYKAANQKLSQAIKQDPRLAKELGLSADAIEKLSSSTKPPIGYSWHHHQDVGRMQLVSLEEHQLAAPHTGGMAIWGGGQ